LAGNYNSYPDEAHISMTHEARLITITKRLLEFTPTVANSSLFPTVVPEAAPLIETDPYAFLIAVCLDRGSKAEVIWTIPYDMKVKLGHLDPQLIYKMSLEELAELFLQLPRKPRYVNDAPKTIRDLTRFVVEECDGDASNVWEGRRASDVNRILQSIHGVGSGIANMGVLLIEKAFDKRFHDLDRSRMDIKPDVHTVRVLYRLGASEAQTVDTALATSRLMNPTFPGGLDGGLWEIGRRWCYASNPNCDACPMNRDCAKLIH
jgi:endonuclease III